VALAAFCIVFYEMFVLLGIGNDAMAIVSRSQDAMRLLKSSEQSDDDKEAMARQRSMEMFKATLNFALKLVVIGVALYLVFWSTTTLRPDLRDALLRSLYSPVVIVLMTVGTMFYAWVRRILRGAN
jgi:cytochrome c biogenesis protein CcdA